MKKTKGLVEEEGFLATAKEDDHFDDTYEIEIDSSVKKADEVEMILHELVHIKQFVNGELQYTDDANILLWKGKPYDSTKAYYFQPWEIEAYGYEVGLTKLIEEKLG